MSFCSSSSTFGFDRSQWFAHSADWPTPSVLFNYFDRLALSVAGPSLRQELHLDALTLGVLFSAFSWSYAALQIPSGMILDRFGVTRVGRIGIVLWGVASVITALSGGYGGILLARLLLGAAAAPSFPLNSKAVGHWFPRAERSTATAMFDGMAKFSQVVGVPLVAVALVWFGWRGAFWMTAGLSFLFLIVFWIVIPARMHTCRRSSATISSPAAPYRRDAPMAAPRRCWATSLPAGRCGG